MIYLELYTAFYLIFRLLVHVYSYLITVLSSDGAYSR